MESESKSADKVSNFQNLPQPQVLETIKTAENVEIPPDSKRPSTMWSVWSTYGGIVMSLSASLFFSISFLMIKALDKHGIKAFGSALLFNLGVLLPAIVGIIFNEFGPGWRNRPRVCEGISNATIVGFLTIQGILQGTSVVLRTFSLAYLSVGDMTVIVFSSPVVTTILAHFFVGEPCGFVIILIAIFTLVGVGLITKPPIFTGQKEFDQKTVIGSAIAAGAMLSLSLKFVVTRKIKETHFLVMTFFLGLCGALLSLPLFLIFEDHKSLLPYENDTIGLLLRIGLLTGFCAVASINLALKMEDAGIVALVRSFDVIFAFLLQYIFLGVLPDILSGIGAVIVWTGVLVAGVRKYFSEKENVEIKDQEEGFSHKEGKITFITFD